MKDIHGRVNYDSELVEGQYYCHLTPEGDIQKSADSKATG